MPLWAALQPSEHIWRELGIKSVNSRQPYEASNGISISSGIYSVVFGSSSFAFFVHVRVLRGPLRQRPARRPSRLAWSEWSHYSNRPMLPLPWPVALVRFHSGTSVPVEPVVSTSVAGLSDGRSRSPSG